jgi:hypothetical protein
LRPKANECPRIAALRSLECPVKTKLRKNISNGTIVTTGQRIETGTYESLLGYLKKICKQ